MVSAVNTGVPLQGGTVNSPGERERPEFTYFDALSTNVVSHKIFVTESPILIQAFGLTEVSFVQVLMVMTKNDNSEITQPLILNKRYVALVELNNALLLDLPGVYRLQIEDADLGVISVYGQQTAMSYWSYGLAAYANAVNQTDNPVNPP